jgi:hypothetical protein
MSGTWGTSTIERSALSSSIVSRGRREVHDPNTPAPTLVFSHDERRFVDGHGGTLKGGRFLWVGDRFANRLIVVDHPTRSTWVSGLLRARGWVSMTPSHPANPDILVQSLGLRPLGGDGWPSPRSTDHVVEEVGSERRR